MVNRGPNWFGVIAMCAIYWGALYYWLSDELSAGGDEQSRALVLLATSIPYIAFVMWGTMTDLPEPVSEIPVVGKYAKAYIWLAIVIAFSYWGWVDKAAFGFLLVGVALFGLATGLAQTEQGDAHQEESESRLVDPTPVRECDYYGQPDVCLCVLPYDRYLAHWLWEVGHRPPHHECDVRYRSC